MKKIFLLFTLVILFSCNKSKMKEETVTDFYVGTYTNGESKGIYKYQIDRDGKLSKIGLVANTENPSFLAKSKDNTILFAVDEADVNGTGFIKSFQITADSLIQISKEKTGGAHPCFIGVNDENHLLAANYSGGNVGLLKADKNGKISNLLDIQQHTGKGTTARQEAPHAHSAWFHPTKNKIISVDLGTNQLWFSKIDKIKNELVFNQQKTLQMAEGAGPRHLTFHPNNKWVYVLNELNNTVSIVKEKEEMYYIDTSVSTLPENFTAFSKAADIHISKDGLFLYVSNRGHESIAIFEVNQENGVIQLIGFEAVLGKNPRNFSLSPNEEFLIVANQDTNNIVSFMRDKITGKLIFVSEITAPNPVCILF